MNDDDVHAHLAHVNLLKKKMIDVVVTFLQENPDIPDAIGDIAAYETMLTLIEGVPSKNERLKVLESYFTDLGEIVLKEMGLLGAALSSPDPDSLFLPKIKIKKDTLLH